MEALPSRNPPVTIHLRQVRLSGDLTVPHGAQGIILFAHGSGSSRLSPRNQFVAQSLQEAGLATLLMDLLSLEEERIDARTRHLRFDISLLAERLIATTDWVLEHLNAESPLQVGYFGASTGAGAALMAAAQKWDQIRAVVSRGGRPDLAGDFLGQVRAPTLLIVGGEDSAVIQLNQQAFDELDVEKELRIIPGATHLFEEPGALEQVAQYARAWFERYLLH